ncbi:hypothetical protein [Lacipirellula limnantheis]|uniref:Uncharacterized protein n=1 Tax=Lacipirellula limnantheis TaxID=2528024 RepID=A0A517TX48_9BACT|nr:hypothetical protein [Lacipirellula limnantheis]QDT72955.1 hypothetical protein I41_21420 [Lacipirellula limnantheis]
MLTYLRYALATVCIAASVGCLALWWRSATHYEMTLGSLNNSQLFQLYAYCGGCKVGLGDFGPTNWKYDWKYKSVEFDPEFASLNSSRPHFAASVRYQPRTSLRVSFPLWYSTLVFALAGVASLRLGRRFTIRSAIIATTVVAGLLGMAVIL